MSFAPVALLDELKRLPIPQRYCIAYSGGCDSQVLLHALLSVRAQLPTQAVQVLHVDHGLQAASRQWAAACRAQCAAWGVDSEVMTLRITQQRGLSLEAQAREARYAALAAAMRDGDMLLTAQHETDQAETLLLQLLRGSGSKGLAAMPRVTAFGGGWLARPLLSFTRAELETYARAQGLRWIEDPSNRDTRYDRNYLRQVIMPALQARWPAAGVTLARAARHQADAAELLEQLAAEDYAALRTAKASALQIAGLQALTVPRQRNVLRYWLQRVCGLPLPSDVQVTRILQEVVPAGHDTQPRVHWPGAEVRRFQGYLYAMAPLPALDSRWQVQWDGRVPLGLPDGGQLRAQAGPNGLPAAVLAQGATVRYRRGGEVCRLPGRAHHSALKKLLQDWRVPPWERARIPLVFVDGALAQIVGYSVCEPFCAATGEAAVRITHTAAQSPRGH